MLHSVVYAYASDILSPFRARFGATVSLCEYIEKAAKTLIGIARNRRKKTPTDDPTDRRERANKLDRTEREFITEIRGDNDRVVRKVALSFNYFKAFGIMFLQWPQQQRSTTTKTMTTTYAHDNFN